MLKSSSLLLGVTQLQSHRIDPALQVVAQSAHGLKPCSLLLRVTQLQLHRIDPGTQVVALSSSILKFLKSCEILLGRDVRLARSLRHEPLERGAVRAGGVDPGQKALGARREAIGCGQEESCRISCILGKE
jgi:hypothetical protein